MKHRKRALLYILLGASALTLPQLAMAQTSSTAAQSAREAELAARLERLEAEMTQLRADIAAARTAQAETATLAQAASTRVAETAATVATIEGRPRPDGFRVGSTTVKLTGFIRLVASSSRFSDGEVPTNSFGRDFYLPQSIPTNGGPTSQVQDFNAKQSRFALTLASDVAGHSVKGLVEGDFVTAPGAQGSQRTTNGYNLALRRAYLQVDRWTLGQDWSTFQYTAALPESTDFVGATEGTVFVRQALVRYSAPLTPQLTLHASLENAESGTANLGAPALIENGDDKLPDFVARLAYSGKAGELSLAALGRQVRIENAGNAARSTGWGISGAGKIYLNEARSSDVRFMATYGQNIGRYVGLNFAPDGVFVPATGNLADVNVFAGLAAARFTIAPKLRLNLIGSYQTVDYDNALALAGIGTFNKEAWSGAVNLFYTPVAGIDLGIEYRRGERELVNGAQGSLDRFEFAAKYSF